MMLLRHHPVMLPSVRVHYPHVRIIEAGVHKGAPVIDVRPPVFVYRLWSWHRKGVPVAVLVKRYPRLTPSQVLCALAFSYDNEELMIAEHERMLALLDEQTLVPDTTVTAEQLRKAAGLDGHTIIVGGFAPGNETPNARTVHVPESDRSDDDPR